MRPSSLQLFALVATGTFGIACDGSITRPIAGTFRGHFTDGFEVSDFRQCGSAASWWLGGDLQAIGEFKQDSTRYPRGSSATLYIELEGVRSARGRHGHLGHYPYNLTANQILKVQLPSGGDCL